MKSFLIVFTLLFVIGCSYKDTKKQDIIISDNDTIKINKTFISKTTTYGGALEINEGEDPFDYWTVDSFNIEGKKIKSETYFNRKLWGAFLFEYDTLGRLTTYYSFDENNNPSRKGFKRIISYDSLSREVLQEWYDIDNIVRTTIITTYADESKYSKTINRDESGYSYIKFSEKQVDGKYLRVEHGRGDRNGDYINTISLNRYDANGNLKTDSVFSGPLKDLYYHSTYKHDKAGNILEYKCMSPDNKILSSSKSEYEFDSLNNWIRHFSFKEGERTLFSEREIIYGKTNSNIIYSK